MLLVRVIVCSVLVAGTAAADGKRPVLPRARAKPAAARNAEIKYSPTAGESNIPSGAVALAEPALPEPAVVAEPAPKPLPVQRHRGLRIGLGLASGAVLIGGIVALGIVFSSHGDSGTSDWGTLVVMRR